MAEDKKTNTPKLGDLKKDLKILSDHAAKSIIGGGDSKAKMQTPSGDTPPQ